MVSSNEDLCTDSCQRACLLTTSDESSLTSCLEISCGCQYSEITAEEESNSTVSADELIALEGETESHNNNETTEISDEEL